MIIKRNIAERFQHFRGKLLFVSGPRQAGKTFIIENKLKPDLELNMDVAKERISFKQFPDFIIQWYQTNVGRFPSRDSGKKKPLIFLDEIHKVKGWRNIMKGTFDKTRHAIDYVASGSSAFKLRKQDRGDSLAGRAIWLNLFPISFREYVKSYAPEIRLKAAWHGDSSLVESVRSNVKHAARLRELWDDFVRFGSFPENLVRKDEIFYQQWLEDYLSAMLDRDLKDLHVAKDVERVYQVFQLLIEGIGSTYSLRSLAETLSVSPNTIISDVKAIKQVLWGFELPVVMVSKARQIRKEKKFYPIDFCFIAYKEPFLDGAKFECMIACLMQRGLSFETAGLVSKFHFGFYRDYNQKEVDFVFKKGREIVLAVECKLKKRSDHNLKSFARFKPRESLLIVEEPGVFESLGENIYAISAELLAPCLE